MEIRKEFLTLLIVLGIAIGFALGLAYMGIPNTEHINQIAKDTNQLLLNDYGFAQYIQANSQTFEYINKNCKVTQDNNDITVLTCVKVKA